MSTLSKMQMQSEIHGIVCCDRDEANGLEVYCYQACSNDSPETVKNSRGLVFHQDKLIFRGLPYTDEYPVSAEELPSILDPIFAKGARVCAAYEGNIIRVFCWKGNWFVTTHRKLDAFQSKWGPKKVSFGENFQCALEKIYHDETSGFSAYLETAAGGTTPALGRPDPDSPLRAVLERFLSVLDPKRQYTFLVSHDQENRIVCLPQEKVYHICTQDASDFHIIENDYVGLPQPEELSIQTHEALVKYVKSINIWAQQGVVIFPKDNPTKPIKILNDMYHYLFHLRGNEQSINFRYLQLRNDSYAFHWYCTLYPEKMEEFQRYEQVLLQIAQTVYDAYVTRYVKGEWVVLPPAEYSILKKLYDAHLQHPDDEVTYDKTLEIVNYHPPSYLNQIIRRRLKEQKKTNESSSPPAE